MTRPMTINEAAHYLGVSPDTVRRHVRMGLLEAEQKPRGTCYKWVVTVPDQPAADSSTFATRPNDDASYAPSAEEYRRLGQLVDELRSMLRVATEELDSRRQEVAQLLSLLQVQSERSMSTRN